MNEKANDMRGPSIIPSGQTLAGTITGEGDLVVFGRVEGPIDIDGVLVIEAVGAVLGDVRARAVSVRGALKGAATADRTVRVDKEARVIGDLTAPRVAVAPGARFRGDIHTGDDAFRIPEVAAEDAQAVEAETETPVAAVPVPAVSEPPAAEHVSVEIELDLTDARFAVEDEFVSVHDIQPLVDAQFDAAEANGEVGDAMVAETSTGNGPDTLLNTLTPQGDEHASIAVELEYASVRDGLVQTASEQLELPETEPKDLPPRPPRSLPRIGRSRGRLRSA